MTKEEFLSEIERALPCVGVVYDAISKLGITHNDRSNIALPLLLASLDTGEAALVLLKLRPERGLVPALALERVQIEHVYRAAFFAAVATEHELARFQQNGKMPVRRLKKRRQQIRVRQILREVEANLGFQPSELAELVYPRYEQLSTVIHGGIEIPRMYWQNDEMGDLRLEDWTKVIPEVRGIVAYLQMALSVAMMMSPLDQQRLNAAVQEATNYLKGYMPSEHE